MCKKVVDMIRAHCHIMDTNKEEELEMHMIKEARNKQGIKFAIGYEHKEVVSNDEYKVVTETNEKEYFVFKLCSNYDGKVMGGIRKTWRYIARGLTLEQAETLLEKKNKDSKGT